MAIDLERFPTSESAQRMIASVSEEFYEKSYVGKWIYQVMGLEWDDVWAVIEAFPEQAFPETATWGLKYHEMKWGLPVRENLDYEERRRRIYQKRDMRAPMNPWRLEWYLSNATGHNIRIEDIHDEHLYGWEPPHPNVFKVYITDVEGTANVPLLKARLNALRQSHTTYTMQERVGAVIDHSDLEHIEAFRMILRLAVDFWGLPYFLDGSRLLDGSILLGNNKRYDLIPGIKYHLRIPMSSWRTEVPKMLIRTHIETPEEIGAGTRFGWEADFWRNYFLDGSLLLDGSFHLDGGRRYDLIPGFMFGLAGPEPTERITVPSAYLRTTIQNAERVDAAAKLTGWGAAWNGLDAGGATAKLTVPAPRTEEEISEVTLETKTRDCAFLDGSLLMDGSRQLNSIYRKEAI